jgi:glycerate dehydrogenase
VEQVVFLDRGTIAPQIQMAQLSFPHRLTEYDHTEAGQVVERARDATIIINNKVPLKGETLAQLKKLKLIAVAATGTDAIDKKYCHAHGIAISNIRGYAAHTVPEHTMALILALQRNLVGYRQDVIDGEWQRSGQFTFFTHPIRDLSGKNLGVIGEGALGQGVARLARAFGMRIMFAAHKHSEGWGPLYTPWSEVIETSDVITLHSPLIESTRNLIAYPEFKRMRKKPILVNTSRGGLVVEEDLERALAEGLISGAALDVTSPEPPAKDSVIMRIAKRPNVIVTPHIAWASDEAQQALTDQLFENIENFMGGRPTNLVTGEF